MDSVENLNLSINLNKSKINLSNMTELKEANITWNKKITGLEKCKKLEKLQVWHFNHPDLKPFLELENITKLDLRTASIKNLEGISKLKKLKILMLGNCSRLKSIQEIETLENLEELIIDTCSNISDYEKIKTFNKMSKFDLKNSKNIKSIQFLAKADRLKSIMIGPRMQVEDGDFRFIKNMHLEYFNVLPTYLHFLEPLFLV